MTTFAKLPNTRPKQIAGTINNARGSSTSSKYIAGLQPDQVLQSLLIVTPLQRDVVTDLSSLVELGERLIHRLHPELTTRLQHRVDLMGLTFSDDVAYRGRREQHF